MSDPVEQWPFTGAGSIGLLRTPSAAGVKIRKPDRVVGPELRELVLRGVVVPTGGSWSVVAPGPLPFKLRWDAAFLGAADPGSLKSMIRASFKDDVRRRAMSLPPGGPGLGQRFKDEFSVKDGRTLDTTPIPTPEDDAQSFRGRGLIDQVDVRWLKIIKASEQRRTALGDDWARSGADLIARLEGLDALVRSDPAAAAELVQTAGGLVAVVPGVLAPIGRLLAMGPPRPAVGGHQYAFDVLGCVEALIRRGTSAELLDHVSDEFRAATTQATAT